jgi:hypothetical protein
MTSIYDKYPTNIFAAKNPEGDLAPVPPLPVRSRAIWHKTPQPAAVH